MSKTKTVAETLAALRNPSATSVLDTILAAAASKNNAASGLMHIPLGDVRVHVDQVRTTLGQFRQGDMPAPPNLTPDDSTDDLSDLERTIHGLAVSIAEVGLAQPITVRRDGDIWRVVDGEHRLLACTLLSTWVAAGLITPTAKRDTATIAAIASEIADDVHITSFQLVTNTQRADMEPADIARAIAKLADFGVPQVKIAKQLGFHRSTVTDLLAIAKNPELDQQLQDLGLGATRQRIRAIQHIETNIPEDDKQGFIDVLADEVKAGRSSEDALKNAKTKTQKVKREQPAADATKDAEAVGGPVAVEDTVFGDTSDPDVPRWVDVEETLVEGFDEADVTIAADAVDHHDRLSVIIGHDVSRHLRERVRALLDELAPGHDHADILTALSQTI